MLHFRLKIFINGRYMFSHYFSWAPANKEIARQEKESNIIELTNKREEIGEEVKGKEKIEEDSDYHALQTKGDTVISKQSPEETQKVR